MRTTPTTFPKATSVDSFGQTPPASAEPTRAAPLPPGSPEALLPRKPASAKTTRASRARSVPAMQEAKAAALIQAGLMTLTEANGVAKANGYKPLNLDETGQHTTKGSLRASFSPVTLRQNPLIELGEPVSMLAYAASKLVSKLHGHGSNPTLFDAAYDKAEQALRQPASDPGRNAPPPREG